MPTSNHQLTHEQFIDLQALVARCKQHDGNTIPIYSHLLLQRRSLPCNLLYYYQQQLVGFLSVFFFYDDACEIVLMVDPKVRRQHIASRLIAMILPVIQARGVEKIVFSTPGQLNNAWYSAKGFSYQKTEYQMQWRGANPVKVHNPSLCFSEAVDDDIAFLVDINEQCFPEENNGMEGRFHHLIHDDNYTLLVIRDKGQPVGKAHLLQDDVQVQLSDIAILPAFQGRGLGQALVAQCIYHVAATSALPVCLDVESNNQHALRLYQKLGFSILNSWDFWVISIEILNCNFVRN